MEELLNDGKLTKIGNVHDDEGGRRGPYIAKHEQDDEEESRTYPKVWTHLKSVKVSSEVPKSSEGETAISTSSSENNDEAQRNQAWRDRCRKIGHLHHHKREEDCQHPWSRTSQV